MENLLKTNTTGEAGLDKYNELITKAYEAGDVDTAVKLHTEDVSKWFGGNVYATGREGLRQFMSEWIAKNDIEFLENVSERTVIHENMAQRTLIFAFAQTPKGGGERTITRGRSQITFLASDSNESGWIQLNEMTQEAPPKEENQ